MRKLLALLMTLTLMASAASGEIEWPEGDGAGDSALYAYIQGVNETLLTLSAGQIDVLYECYPSFATFGRNGAELPDDFEMMIERDEAGLTGLTLRMTDLTAFVAVAAACIHQASPEAISLTEAMASAQGYVNLALASPEDSFEETIYPAQGEQPRIYGAYYPNQYHDRRNWMQLTLIFALPGSGDQGLLVVATPAPPEPTEGYFPYDGYNDHLSVYTSPTPEPDSAAME